MKIVIVGGGPAGLAAAKALGKEPGDFEIDLFELQLRVGGLWNYVPENKESPHDSVNNGVGTAIYKEMETNISKDIITYSEFPLSDKIEVFPSRGEVQQYLEEFSHTIENVRIHLNTEVTWAEKVGDKWQVEVKDLRSKQTTRFDCDALVVGNGHFSRLHYPKVDGLDEWKKTRPHVVTHSKFYDRSEPYRNKRVLVVGNSASGVDISLQVSTCASQVFLSSRKIEDLSDFTNPIVRNIGVVKSYNSDGSITLDDGENIPDIDAVIFCTGYEYEVPFLKSYEDQITLESHAGFKNLYRGIFFIYDPTLIFIALQKQIIPLPLAEAQGVYASRVLSGRIKLPSEEEMARVEKEKTDKYESESQYHYLGYPNDVAYMNELIDDVLRLNDGLGGHNAEFWDKKRANSREATVDKKRDRLKLVLHHVLKLREQGKEFVILRGPYDT